MKKKRRIKVLDSEEIDALIEGIGDGTIIIGGREDDWTPEEIEEYRKIRKKRYDAMSPEEKKELKALGEKFRKEDEDEDR